jgi:hypothetical protein
MYCMINLVNVYSVHTVAYCIYYNLLKNLKLKRAIKEQIESKNRCRIHIHASSDRKSTYMAVK